MAGEIKINDVSVATENAGTVTIAPNNVTFAANHAGIKTALNASGSAPIYACRAWVNFDGRSGNVAIRNSGNVSSLTYNGTGDYTVNFSTDMPHTNYAVVNMIAQSNADPASGGNVDWQIWHTSTTSSVRVTSANNTDVASAADQYFNSICVFC